MRLDKNRESYETLILDACGGSSMLLGACASTVEPGRRRVTHSVPIASNCQQLQASTTVIQQYTDNGVRCKTTRGIGYRTRSVADLKADGVWSIHPVIWGRSMTTKNTELANCLDSRIPLCGRRCSRVVQLLSQRPKS